MTRATGRRDSTRGEKTGRRVRGCVCANRSFSCDGKHQAARRQLLLFPYTACTSLGGGTPENESCLYREGMGACLPLLSGSPPPRPRNSPHFRKWWNRQFSGAVVYGVAVSVRCRSLGGQLLDWSRIPAMSPITAALGRLADCRASLARALQVSCRVVFVARVSCRTVEVLHCTPQHHSSTGYCSCFAWFNADGLLGRVRSRCSCVRFSCGGFALRPRGAHTSLHACLDLAAVAFGVGRADWSFRSAVGCFPSQVWFDVAKPPLRSVPFRRRIHSEISCYLVG